MDAYRKYLPFQRRDRAIRDLTLFFAGLALVILSGLICAWWGLIGLPHEFTGEMMATMFFTVFATGAAFVLASAVLTFRDANKVDSKADPSSVYACSGLIRSGEPIPMTDRWDRETIEKALDSKK